uniref:Uncharacterized protein n=1 Tax=Triticum urartu TaxID=4572 RepID=A0A8R7V391_TRIUA
IVPLPHTRKVLSSALPYRFLPPLFALVFCLHQIRSRHHRHDCIQAKPPLSCTHRPPLFSLAHAAATTTDSFSRDLTLAAVEAFLSLPLAHSPVRWSQPVKLEEISIASLCDPVRHRHDQLSWASCTGGSPIWQTSGCSSKQGWMRREDHLGAAPVTLAGTSEALPMARQDVP